VHLAPLVDGFATIGNVDYLASPVMVESLKVSSRAINIILKGNGRLVCYSEKEPSVISVNSCDLNRVDISPKPGQFCFNNNILIINVHGSSVLITY
jgi:hypothetical protein